MPAPTTSHLLSNVYVCQFSCVCMCVRRDVTLYPSTKPSDSRFRLSPLPLLPSLSRPLFSPLTDSRLLIRSWVVLSLACIPCSLSIISDLSDRFKFKQDDAILIHKTFNVFLLLGINPSCFLHALAMLSLGSHILPHASDFPGGPLLLTFTIFSGLEHSSPTRPPNSIPPFLQTSAHIFPQDMMSNFPR